MRYLLISSQIPVFLWFWGWTHLEIGQDRTAQTLDEYCSNLMEFNTSWICHPTLFMTNLWVFRMHWHIIKIMVSKLRINITPQSQNAKFGQAQFWDGSDCEFKLNMDIDVKRDPPFYISTRWNSTTVHLHIILYILKEDHIVL